MRQGRKKRDGTSKDCEPEVHQPYTQQELTMRKALIPVIFAAVATLSAFAPMGGWATISADPRPDSVATGQPMHLSFVVKQHGVKPLGGLTPRIELRSEGRDTVRLVATAAKETGRYNATVRFPAAGEWFINIHSGFGKSETTLSGQRVIPTARVAKSGQ